jgi:hypothetical protein
MKKLICITGTIVCAAITLSGCSLLASGGASSEQQEDTETSYTCVISIECLTILDHLQELEPGKEALVPEDGVILAPCEVAFDEGETVFDVLQRVCRENKIHMESSQTPGDGGAYIEGINNLYEFDCGSASGWMYSVNDWYPNFSSSGYQLEQGDVVQWRYTCDLGNDIGGAAAGEE